MNKRVQSYKELDTCKLTFDLQQRIFNASRSWPKEEKFSLTDQIRRSSRSIGANLAEAWAKRQYPAHFLSKCSDADGELQETFHWIDTARACGCITDSEHAKITENYIRLGQKLGRMMQCHETFCNHK